MTKQNTYALPLAALFFFVVSLVLCILNVRKINASHNLAQRLAKEIELLAPDLQRLENYEATEQDLLSRPPIDGNLKIPAALPTPAQREMRRSAPVGDWFARQADLRWEDIPVETAFTIVNQLNQSGWRLARLALGASHTQGRCNLELTMEGASPANRANGID